MIALLIVFLVLVVFLAFFIGNNLTNLCTFWFFKDMPDTSVLVLILCSFAAGIIFSIVIFFIGKLKLLSKENSKSTQELQEKKSKWNKKEGKLLKKAENNIKTENKTNIVVKE